MNKNPGELTYGRLDYKVFVGEKYSSLHSRISFYKSDIFGEYLPSLIYKQYSRGLCYKTFYGRNLQIFCNKLESLASLSSLV